MKTRHARKSFDLPECLKSEEQKHINEKQKRKLQRKAKAKEDDEVHTPSSECTQAYTECSPCSSYKGIFYR